MKITLYKNLFGIRTPVRITDRILLGIIPILAILLFWHFTTTGDYKTITLPEGIFEGWESSVPPIGTQFGDSSNRTRYIITDSKLVMENEDTDYPQSYIEKFDKRYSVTGLHVIPMRGSLRIMLPPGKLVKRTGLKPQATSDEDAAIQPIDSTSIPDQTTTDEITPLAEATLAKTSEKQGPPEIDYYFEMVETRIYIKTIIPSVKEVLASLSPLWNERRLPKNIFYSFYRVGAGFLIAFLFVFPISLLMGTFSKFNSLLSPLVLFAGYLPIPALTPLVIFSFGTGETMKVMFLAIAFTIYLLPLFVKALENVDNVYLQTGYTLGAKKYQILNKILLPIAMPDMYNAMRMGFGVGWGYIVLAEMVDMGNFGVGTLILTSQRRGLNADIYLVLIAIVTLAFITDKIWEKVGRELFPYKRQER